MKRFFALLAAALLVLAVVLATTAALFGPTLMKAQIKDAFAGMGFNNVTVGRVFIAPGAVVFRDIQLDADGFSTLETIEATFDVPTLLTTGRLSRLVLSGMTLTALLNSNGSIAIAGWQVPEFEPFVVPVRSIGFDDFKLDLDTMYGSLRFESRGEGLVADDGTVDIQGQLWGEQAQIQIRTAWNGSFEPDGGWSMDVQVEEGRLDLGEIRAARLGGWVSSGMESPGSPLNLGGQLSAGMLAFGPLPMQNVVAVIDGSSLDYQIIVDALAAGTTGMTLHAEFGQSESMFFGSARLATSQPADLPAFLAASGLARSPAAAAAFATLPSLTLEATYLSDESRGAMHHPIALSLRDVSGTLAASARIEADLQKKALTGSLDVPPVSLPALATILPIKALTGAQITAGTLNVEGVLFSDFQAQPPRLEGPLTIEITDLSAKAADTALSGLSGRITFSSLYPPATEGSQTLSFNGIASGLPLGPGKVAFSLGGPDTLSVEEAWGTFAGGRIGLAPVEIKRGEAPDSLSIRIRGIDLARLAKEADIRDLQVTGKLDGDVRLRMAATGPEITEGRLRNRGPGIIYYAPKEYPPFLAGDDPRLKIVREAVTHFEYDTLMLNVAGPLPGRMEATLEAKGWNRPLFGERPVHLNLNLEGAIPALLTNKTKR